MKKRLYLFLALVFLCFLAGALVWQKIPDMVAHHLSQHLQIPVQIGKIGFGWNKISVKQIAIGNPPQSVLSHAFTCRILEELASFPTFFQKNITIEQITLDDVYLGLEFDSTSSAKGNWTQIVKNAQGNTPKPTDRDEVSRKVLIKSLVLNNIQVDVVYRSEGSRVKRLPPIDRIELTNITSEGGLPMDQVMDSVLGQMLRSVFIKKNLKNMLENLVDPKSDLQKIIQPFQRFLGLEESP